MSDPLRIVFVAEGPTDFILLQATLDAVLGGQEFEPLLLQPEMTEAFLPVAGDFGLGWPGIYRWCRQAAAMGDGSWRGNPAIASFAAVVVLLDADVAGCKYSDGHITDASSDLPCEAPCPPPSATTNPLRKVLLRWMGESTVPSNVVLCTPSKAIETWVLAALYPDDRLVRSRKLECASQPEAQLANKPLRTRLILSGQKVPDRYKARAREFAEKWAAVCESCSEAQRFSDDFMRIIALAD